MITQEEEVKKLIDERIRILIPEYLKTAAFTDRKLTDMPTDALQVVPRKFVTNNGSTAGRPTGSTVGQPYFDTDLGYPIWKNQNTRWVSGTGSIVG